jgi:hypothetical protein
VITGEENFLHRTLSNVGVPALHILRAHNGLEYRFYELTGDLPEALHFHDFEQTEPLQPVRGRIRLKADSHANPNTDTPAPRRVKLHE